MTEVSYDEPPHTVFGHWAALSTENVPLSLSVMISSNLVRRLDLSGAAAPLRLRLAQQKKLSGGSASSGVNRGSKRNRVPQ
jgi:hypothetical protein